MTFIIAEVGSNWTSLEDCFDSIVSAKACGADAVKFQLYSHRELYGSALEIRYHSVESIGDKIVASGSFTSGYKMPGELPREWISKLSAKCQEVGIEFMCSAFSPNGIQFLDPYVKRHKIASAELTHIDMLKMAKVSRKPVILSTGGSTVAEVKEAISHLDRTKLTLMYCVAAYPATDVALDGIHFLVDKFNLPVGYSCHTNEPLTPYYAANRYGAPVIEKHFKIRDMATPDNGHAINPKQFKEMVTAIRRGQWFVPFPHPLEDDMVKIHKRRFRPELGGYYRGKA